MNLFFNIQHDWIYVDSIFWNSSKSIFLENNEIYFSQFFKKKVTHQSPCLPCPASSQCPQGWPSRSSSWPSWTPPQTPSHHDLDHNLFKNKTLATLTSKETFESFLHEISRDRISRDRISHFWILWWTRYVNTLMTN